MSPSIAFASLQSPWFSSKPSSIQSSEETNRSRHKHSFVIASAKSEKSVTVLDYGAGNVRSLENAVRLFGYDIQWAKSASDIANANKLIFPGVGSFGAAMHNLQERGYIDALKEYIEADRPFLGICLGLHTLYESSAESPGIAGLGVMPGSVEKFDVTEAYPSLAVPSIGWNLVSPRRDSILLQPDENTSQSERFYFVHSYRIGMDVANKVPDAILGTTRHGEEYLSVLQRGRLCATQFHPEKSGPAGLRLIRNFLRADDIAASPSVRRWTLPSSNGTETEFHGLAKRVVACLDVRENDAGDLVVTKGDQYDVREKDGENEVRNLGKPVDLATRYFEEGADEVCFLNITSFRGEPVGSAPMIEVLERTSRGVFVPLCIGGGIRDYTDREGRSYSALDVASMYFRAGADKISLGSDAVYAAEKLIASGKDKGDGSSSIERISHVYGAQAVVISVDPKRVYVESADETSHATVQLPDGRLCWYQCTVKGGREGRDLDVVQLVQAAERLGAGEILVNSMDQDGQNQGYDLQLVKMVRDAVSIPVIASSGAGKPQHFTQCFDSTDVEAALAAGIFHRQEVAISEVKDHMRQHGTPVRVAGALRDVLQVPEASV